MMQNSIKTLFMLFQGMETELNKDNSEIIPQQAGCSSTNKLVYSHFVIPLGYLEI